MGSIVLFVIVVASGVFVRWFVRGEQEKWATVVLWIYVWSSWCVNISYDRKKLATLSLLSVAML